MIFVISSLLFVTLVYSSSSISDICAAPKYSKTVCFYNNEDQSKSTEVTCCYNVIFDSGKSVKYCDFCSKDEGGKWECSGNVQQPFAPGALDLPEGLDVKPTPPSEPKRPGGDTGLEPESLAPSNDTSNDTKVPKDLGGLNGNGPMINPESE